MNKIPTFYAYSAMLEAATLLLKGDISQIDFDNQIALLAFVV